MSVFIYILFIMTSSVMIIDSRSLRSSDPLMPFLISSVIDDDGNVASLPSNGPNRLLFMIKHITKYVSTIKSSEHFIDEIINRQKDVANKMKILKFLNNCFRLTDTLIQREIIRALDLSSHTNQKRLFSSLFTFEELQQAHYKIKNLLQVIEERMDTLKTWIPPTMPFLNF